MDRLTGITVKVMGMGRANDRITVMLTTEGTYPFHQGGVSTWADTLVNKLQSVDFVIYSVLMNPFVTQKFSLPDNARLIRVPLWGTEEPSEHFTVPFSEIYLKKKYTMESDIRIHFIPLFVELVEEILVQPNHPKRFGMILLHLHQFFQQYEYKVVFKSETTWNVYKELVLKTAADKKNGFSQPNIHDLIQSLGWVYRFLNIVNTPFPKTHVCHSSAAAFCGIPCVLAKLQDKTPFLLTEHGVYLREQYLSLSKRGYSSFLNTFLIRFVQAVSSLNYAYADQISPVCEYNTRWETVFGVERKNIDVIYNGVDEKVFSEIRETTTHFQPTVVMVARIDPIKDIKSFLQAAGIVRNRMPEVRFIVYGSVSVPEYYEECLELKQQLQLGDSFIFAGHTSNMAAAYHSGDVVALSSISEAFPYSVVEAMMTGKPVIATDVGGIKEALGDTGILVRPREPEDMARGIMKLLSNHELRDTLGKEARQRALNLFTLDNMMERYLQSYMKLAIGTEETLVALPAAAPSASKRQVLLLDKGYALAANGFYREAIEQFRLAVKEQPNSPFVPVILTEIASAYNYLGEFDKVFQELERYEAYVQIMQQGSRESA